MVRVAIAAQEPPAPDQSAQESPLERAIRLRPLFAEHAATSEREGRIADPVLAALKASGLFHITAAKRGGGEGRPISDYVEVVAEMAKGCAGSAWAFGILAAATGMVASLPPIITQAIFRRGDELVHFVGARSGTATPVEGGYLVSGAWRYGSGCLHADWTLCSVRVLDKHGGEPRLGTVFLDHADAEHVGIVHDWHVAGLLASGSNQVRATEHFVPAHLMLPLVNASSDHKADPGTDREPRDSWPSEIQFPLTVLPAMLGAAEGMLAAVRAAMNTRPVLNWRYAHQSDSQALLAALGDAAMKIETGWMHVRWVCSLMDEVAPVRPVKQMELIKAQAACGFGMRMVREAANTLLDIAGPASFANTNPIQRLWRDINVGTRHNALNAGFSLELLGRALADVESNFDVIPVFDEAVGSEWEWHGAGR